VAVLVEIILLLVMLVVLVAAAEVDHQDLLRAVLQLEIVFLLEELLTVMWVEPV
jgi:hypothetical protein